MRQRARDRTQRLDRVEQLGRAQTGEATDWLTDLEFDTYTELRRSGLPVEANECHRLLAVAQARRARGEAKPNNLWRVDAEEGRPTVIPQMSDEELEAWTAKVNAERPAGGRLVERGDGNYNWRPDR